MEKEENQFLECFYEGVMCTMCTDYMSQPAEENSLQGAHFLLYLSQRLLGGKVALEDR